VVLAVIVLAAVRTRMARRWELRAARGGREVVIYSTVDETTFNQVARALQRVIESYPEHRSRPGAVAA